MPGEKKESLNVKLSKNILYHFKGISHFGPSVRLAALLPDAWSYQPYLLGHSSINHILIRISPQVLILFNSIPP